MFSCRQNQINAVISSQRLTTNSSTKFCPKELQLPTLFSSRGHRNSIHLKSFRPPGSLLRFRGFFIRSSQTCHPRIPCALKNTTNHFNRVSATKHSGSKPDTVEAWFTLLSPPCRIISFFWVNITPQHWQWPSVINVGKHTTRISCSRSSSSLVSSIFNEKETSSAHRSENFLYSSMLMLSHMHTNTPIFRPLFPTHDKPQPAAASVVAVLHGKMCEIGFLFHLGLSLGVLGRDQRKIRNQSNRGGPLLWHRRKPNVADCVLILYSPLLGAHSRRGILLVLCFQIRTSVWNPPLFFTKIHTHKIILFTSEKHSGDNDGTITPN